MTSILRSLFSSSSNSKSRRSSSASKNAKNENYVYLMPPPVPSGATPKAHKRSESCAPSTGSRVKATSPLQYSYLPSYPQTPMPSVVRPEAVPVYFPPRRAASHKHKSERPPAYPLCAPNGSFNSLYSTSSGYESSQPSHSRPRTPTNGNARSSSAGTSSSHRSVLKRSQPDSVPKVPKPHAHVSFQHPDHKDTLHMHPLLAHSSMSRAPISYDVKEAPSARTVVDHSTRQPLPSHTLLQPATDPPTYGTLVLHSDKLPWPVVVGSMSAPAAASRFFITGPSGAKSARGSPGPPEVPITNLDVLHALHNTLAMRVTREEWNMLGDGTRAQRKVTRAYDTRCTRMGGGWDGGVRRIDWLGEKTRFVGVEVDKASDVGKLVFARV